MPQHEFNTQTFPEAQSAVLEQIKAGSQYQFVTQLDRPSADLSQKQ
jgi:hypothetical protein